MSDTTETAAVETSGDSVTSTAAATEADTAAPGLGDAGKQAIDRMKAERNDARTAAKDLEAKYAALEAKVAGKEAEFTAAQEAQRIKDEALAAADQRILKAEVRAAAATKLTDPQDALRFLDLSTFEVGQDGEVDASQVAKAIDDLISTKPYLSAQGGQRFQGSADGGARTGAATPSPISSEAELKTMTPAEINQARRDGRLDALLRKH